MPSGSAAEVRAMAQQWLADRPRDDRGLPIPWINRWGAETVAATRIGWDPHIGRTAAFHDDFGKTVDFTRQNMGRQRQAMVAGLCQVCGRQVPWSRRNLVVSSVSVEAVSVQGRTVAAVTEPWLDDRCATIATVLCPALIRRRREDDLRVIPVRRAADVQLIASVGRLDIDALRERRRASTEHLDALRAAAARGPVGLWVKAALTGVSIRFRDGAGIG